LSSAITRSSIAALSASTSRMWQFGQTAEMTSRLLAASPDQLAETAG
jgi:hypothetical protein